MSILFKNENKPQMAKLSRDPMTMMQRMMSEYFDDAFGRNWPGLVESRLAKSTFSPDVEVKQKEDQITVTAELPGLVDKDVTLTLERDVLCIEGEKKSEKDETKEGRTYSERTYGYFRREIPMPFEVDQERAKAEFKNGVLKIELNKAPSAKTMSRKINITG